MAKATGKLPDTVQDLLRAKSFVHLALVDGDTPHVSPVWVDVDDSGRIIVNTAEGRTKARLLRDGAKVALSATDPENPYRGIMVQGRVIERTHEGADDVIDRLSDKYLGKVPYPFRQPGEQRVTVVIEPERVVGA